MIISQVTIYWNQSNPLSYSKTLLLQLSPSSAKYLFPFLHWIVLNSIQHSEIFPIKKKNFLEPQLPTLSFSTVFLLFFVLRGFYIYCLHFCPHSLLYTPQSEFNPNHSTKTLLVPVTIDLYLVSPKVSSHFLLYSPCQ